MLTIVTAVGSKSQHRVRGLLAEMNFPTLNSMTPSNFSLLNPSCSHKSSVEGEGPGTGPWDSWGMEQNTGEVDTAPASMSLLVM